MVDVSILLAFVVNIKVCAANTSETLNPKPLTQGLASVSGLPCINSQDGHPTQPRPEETLVVGAPYTNKYIYIYMCVCVCVYIFIYRYIHIHMYVHIEERERERDLSPFVLHHKICQQFLVVKSTPKP